VLLSCRSQLKDQLGAAAAAGQLHVYASPFSRTMQTAELAVSQLDATTAVQVSLGCK
jgi:broad specificity phosphatase PhoE